MTPCRAFDSVIMLQDVRNLQRPCRLQHQSLDVTALPPLRVLLFMQLNYDSAAQRVGTEPGLKCSNESNQGFFFYRRCALNVVVFNQRHVSGPVQRCQDEGCFIYFYSLFCVLLIGEDLWPSVPHVSGSGGFYNKLNVS